MGISMHTSLSVLAIDQMCKDKVVEDQDHLYLIQNQNKWSLENRYNKTKG